MAPLAAAFYGEPTEELRVVGVTGTNGKTTTAFLVRQPAGGRGAALRAARDGAAGRRRGGRGGRADHAGGDRPAGDVRAHARGGRPRLRDGGLLARARAAPRRRDPLRRQGLHQPDARTTSTSTPTWRTTSPPSGCSSRRGRRRRARVLQGGVSVINVDDPYGRRLADERDRGASRRPASPTPRPGARPTSPRAASPSTPPGPRFTCLTPGGHARGAHPAPGRLQRGERAGRPRGGPRARARPARRRRGAGARPTRSRAASRRSTRASPSRVLVDYAHTPGLARERAARGAAAHRTAG